MNDLYTFFFTSWKESMRVSKLRVLFCYFWCKTILHRESKLPKGEKKMKNQNLKENKLKISLGLGKFITAVNQTIYEPKNKKKVTINNKHTYL